jgi:hypothetical protein
MMLLDRKKIKMILGRHCLKVQTANELDHEDSAGRMAIWVDHGAGLQAANTFEKFNNFGSIVLDQCYFTFVSLEVQSSNPDDGWLGSISYSSDGGATHASIVCASGCSDAANLSALWIGGTDVGDAVGCDKGRTCSIEPRKCPFHSIVSVRSTPMKHRRHHQDFWFWHFVRHSLWSCC